MDLNFIIILGLLAALGYGIQSWTFHCKKGLLLRLLPGLLLLTGAVGCWIPLVAIPQWEDLIAFIGVFFLAIGLGAMCLGCLAAWIVFLISRKKNSQFRKFRSE